MPFLLKEIQSHCLALWKNYFLTWNIAKINPLLFMKYFFLIILPFKSWKSIHRHQSYENFCFVNVKTFLKIYETRMSPGAFFSQSLAHTWLYSSQVLSNRLGTFISIRRYFWRHCSYESCSSWSKKSNWTSNQHWRNQ